MDAKQADLLYNNCGEEHTHLYHQRLLRLREPFHPQTHSTHDSNSYYRFVRKIIKMKTFKLSFSPGAVHYVVQDNSFCCLCG